MKSVMAHRFSEVPQAEIPRSQFDRSHGLKTTFDAGFLIPVFVDEALPGDTFNVRMTAFARMATPINPVMDNLFLDSFFFAVPNRLLWQNWERFCGWQETPGDSTDYTIPTLTYTWTEGSIGDQMGLPPGITTKASSLPFRAYNLIWNEWFRDQNLQTDLFVRQDDGPDSGGNHALKRRGKRHDYFTSCLPWPQKGTAVDLPLGSTAPVVSAGAGSPLFEDSAGNLFGSLQIAGTGSPTDVRVANSTGQPAGDFLHWQTTALEADLSTATAATINDMRSAFQIQKMLERDARGGTRYTEVVKSHFGVTSPDARLQRPEYLGGGSTPVNISPIAQTSESGTTPQGNLSAIGTANLNGHGFTKSFTEHCIIIGLVSARADLTYQQGVERMWRRETRYDFYWPALAHIGEQAVLNGEIYWQNTTADDNVFGYQERYAEYRYKPSRIAGAFRSTAAASLDAWHLSQEFSSLPVLNNTFIEENPPVDRVIAVPAEPHFLFDAYFDFKAARPMPVFGTPGMIDHL